MRNLTRINLSNSYMYGTIPQWIGELRHLELLNLGTMTGLGYGSGTGVQPVHSLSQHKICGDGEHIPCQSRSLHSAAIARWANVVYTVH